jgi:hypothetical protein
VKKLLVFGIAVVVVAVVLVFVVFQNRKVGQVYVCEMCKQTIRDMSQNKFLPVWSDEKLVTQYDFCERCGGETVAVAIGQSCIDCGARYGEVQAIRCARKERRRDDFPASGYCSRSCELKHNAKALAGKAWDKGKELGEKAAEGLRNLLGK